MGAGGKEPEDASGVAAALERELRDLRILEAATAELDRGSDEVESVLQAIVEHACDLLAAPYGALIVQEPDGSPRHFVHAGVAADGARRIGAAPRGKGLLALRLAEGGALRIDDARADPRAHGVPDGHPQMRALLVVSVPCGPDARAELYVADDRASRVFDLRDEGLLRRFALRAGLAITRSRRHRRRTDLEIAVERDRLARELHDDTAQVLSYVHLTAGGVERLLAEGRTDAALERLRQLGAAARSAAADLRAGIRALRTAADSDRPLAEAVRVDAERWSAESGIPVVLAVDPAADAGAEVRLQLLRIVQEALANARKHAAPRRVRLEIAAEGGTIQATVTDDGVGFRPERVAGDGRFGLAMMQERARGAGGEVVVESAPGRGTRVTVRLPRGGGRAFEPTDGG